VKISGEESCFSFSGREDFVISSLHPLTFEDGSKVRKVRRENCVLNDEDN